jgi:tetratricopeptide (TPR) repeat protein
LTKKSAKKKKKAKRAGWSQTLRRLIRSAKFPLLLIGIALIPRLLALWGLTGSPLFYHPAIDSKSYQDLAVQIASGDFAGFSSFWQAPLYPYFLGIIYLIFGVHILVASLIQVILGAVNCYLIFLLADRVFSRQIAWTAFAAAVIYGPFIFFETQLLAPVLLNFLALVTLLLLLSYNRKPSVAKILSAGLLLGLAQIGHGLILAFLPPLVIWLFLRLKGSSDLIRNGIRASFYLLLGFLPPILATTVHNYAMDKEVVLVSSNFGANFYLGNHPNYDSTTAIRPGLEWDEFIQQAVVNGYVTPAQRSKYFEDKAWEYISFHPIGFGSLLLKKLYLLTAGEEIKRNLDIYHFREYSLILAGLVWKLGIFFPSGIVLPFAIGWMLIFLVTKRSQGRGLDKWLLWLFVASQAAAILLFFVNSRYRLIMMPVALIFAAAMVWKLVELVRSFKWHKALPSGLLVFLLLVFCNIPRIAPTARDRAESLFYEGLAYSNMHKYSTAVEKYQAALQLRPTYSMALLNIANCYREMGKDSLATTALNKIITDNPKSFVADLMVGRAFMSAGQDTRAEQLFRKVLELNPNSAQARGNLGDIYRVQGDTTNALRELREALKIDPKYYKAYGMIGAVYFGMRKFTEAAANFRKALEINPSYTSALSNLATIAAQSGRLDEAAAYLKRAIKIAPNDESVVLNYGALKLREKKPAEALKYFNHAVELSPRKAEPYHYRGVAYLSLRRTRDAINEFKAALRIDPNYMPSRQELRRLGVN